MTQTGKVDHVFDIVREVLKGFKLRLICFDDLDMHIRVFGFSLFA